MEISPLGTATRSAAAATPPSSRSGVISSDFEVFLKMLTAQMTNQDPLNPIESADYAVQLATFSQVEQQVLTNDLLTGLMSQMNLSGMAQMAGWVGQEARAPIPAGYDGAPITISPNPAAIADEVALVVTDEAGEVVQEIDLPVSAEPYVWTGLDDGGAPLPEGLYRFEVVSSAEGEELLRETAELYQRVTEVLSIGDEIVLQFAGGQQIPASLISALRQPPAA
ncbi:flagellar hook capping FlgD N-terminal domain-containing protein [Wenxinia marina]|uniref:Basal-body rod modification protein FlgD n=1 Tax=Wenxinia marina DSM 24838 TaxID=1123501 RepID=A0A0D0NSC4_9RHOB|nr:flagellar hook capping FlgD N-terminal domain-containing protein [Wenxinia marina]KIQ71120.1 Flagellar hook capping protein [Wenxinia marina DSM 24838]GGL54681.1 basal-body rod modification protein FlgD [Wenxinia marina]